MSTEGHASGRQHRIEGLTVTAGSPETNEQVRAMRATLDGLFREVEKVIVGERSHPLEQPFLVMATQNPIEQEGTYPLPEAQVDRFMLKLKLNYPSKDEELAILNRMESVEPKLETEPILAASDVFRLRA